MQSGHLTHWVWKGFWSADQCRVVREAMDLGAADPAEVLEDAIEHQDHVRRTLSIDVAGATLELTERSLEEASFATCPVASIVPIATRATCRPGLAPRAVSWQSSCS
jgi:uncharacterized SAM-dependent methyltransferase